LVQWWSKGFWKAAWNLPSKDFATSSNTSGLFILDLLRTTSSRHCAPRHKRSLAKIELPFEKQKMRCAWGFHRKWSKMSHEMSEFVLTSISMTRSGILSSPVMQLASIVLLVVVAGKCCSNLFTIGGDGCSRASTFDQKIVTMLNTASGCQKQVYSCLSRVPDFTTKKIQQVLLRSVTLKSAPALMIISTVSS
jgi:hypothetical protein